VANEITISIIASNSQLQDDFAPSAMLIDQTTIGADGGVTLVGVAEEVLTFSDVEPLNAPVTDPAEQQGFFMMTNLDDTNFVTYGPEGSGSAMVAFGKIRPGHSAILQLDPDVTFRWKAATSPVKVQWKMWEV